MDDDSAIIAVETNIQEVGKGGAPSCRPSFCSPTWPQSTALGLLHSLTIIMPCKSAPFNIQKDLSIKKLKALMIGNGSNGLQCNYSHNYNCGISNEWDDDIILEKWRIQQLIESKISKSACKCKPP
ncbi:hypothetical protein DINM_006458 [Dirofilaria immitis]|nr:hypothetical protein [Dirofilaria immitis]